MVSNITRSRTEALPESGLPLQGLRQLRLLQRLAAACSLTSLVCSSLTLRFFEVTERMLENDCCTAFGDKMHAIK